MRTSRSTDFPFPPFPPRLHTPSGGLARRAGRNQSRVAQAFLPVSQDASIVSAQRNFRACWPQHANGGFGETALPTCPNLVPAFTPFPAKEISAPLGGARCPHRAYCTQEHSRPLQHHPKRDEDIAFHRLSFPAVLTKPIGFCVARPQLRPFA